MSEFSVSYAGIEDAVSRLASISRQIANISSDIYQASSKVDNIESLKNNGYCQKISTCAKNVDTVADRVFRQGVALSEIGQQYSQSEKKALDALADRVTPQNGFSAQSCLVAATAATLHANPSFDESLKTTFGDRAHDVLSFVDKERTLRKDWMDEHMPEGSWQRKAYEALLGKTIGKAEKKLSQIEEVLQFILNPTNPYAFKDGAEAASGLTGGGEYYKLFERQYYRADAINQRTQEEFDKGNFGRGFSIAIIDWGIYGIEVVGDIGYTTFKTFSKKPLDAITGGKATQMYKALDKVFSDIGSGMRNAGDKYRQTIEDRASSGNIWASMVN